MAQDAVKREGIVRETVAVLFVAVALLPRAVASAEPGVSGSIVVAKSGAAAMILWDATPEVIAAKNNQTPQAQTMLHLETLALQILHDKSAALTHSKTMTIRVLYDKTGDVSPVYHTATFEGVEHVFDLTAPRRELVKQYAKLAAEVAQEKIAAPLHLDMTGTLPPE